MILALSLGAIFLLWIYVASVFKNRNPILTTALSVGGFLAIYILSSAMFVWVDKFSVFNAVIASLIVTGVLSASRLARKKYPAVTVNRENILSMIIPIAIFVSVVVIFGSKYGYFGMGQDEGVYQIKALFYINGHNENVYTLNTISSLPQDIQQTVFGATYSQTVGFYTEGEDCFKGTMHGIATYPALLAWWGTMFGETRMGGVNTLLLFVSTIVLFNTARSMNVRTPLSTAITIIFAISPALIWVNKSYLTENVLIMLVILFMFLISNAKESTRIKIISSIPLVAFAFFHVAVYVMVPMFVVIYFFMFFYKKDRMWLIPNVVVIAAYVLGYMFMLKTAYSYVSYNYLFLSRIGINTENISTIIYVLSAIVIAVNVILFIVYGRRESNSSGKKYYAETIFSWIIRGVAVLSLGFFIKNYQSFLEIGNISNIYSTSMYSYIAMSALIIMPIVYVVMFIRPNIFFKSEARVMTAIMFIYAVLIYSAFFSVETKLYYYLSRYTTVYLSVILLAFALIFSDVPKKIVRLVVAIAITLWSIYLYMPFLNVLRQHADDTRMSFESYEEIVSELKSGDVVIMDEATSSMLYLYSDIINGVKVFPVINGDIDYTYNLVKDLSDNVYFVTQSSDEEAAKDGAGLIGINIYSDGLNQVSGTENYNFDEVKSISARVDTLFKTSDVVARMLPYPLDYIEFNYNIDIYRMTPRT